MVSSWIFPSDLHHRISCDRIQQKVGAQANSPGRVSWGHPVPQSFSGPSGAPRAPSPSGSRSPASHVTVWTKHAEDGEIRSVSAFGFFVCTSCHYVNVMQMSPTWDQSSPQFQVGPHKKHRPTNEVNTDVLNEAAFCAAVPVIVLLPRPPPPPLQCCDGTQ